ncbi:ankyrin repeat protein, partial [Wilcoxina mikolae CBS 423.85]
HRAARNNMVESTRILLAHGADKNAKSDGGWTPLHMAAANNFADVIRVLVEHEHVVNPMLVQVHLEIRDDQGRTPLQLAVVNGHEEPVRLLLVYGANKDSRDAEG